DDGPTVTLTGNTPPTVTDDESNFNVNNTGDFSGQFTASFGADGPAASGSLIYALDTVGGNSNLKDTASQLTVVVAKEGNDVVGRAGAGGAIVFVVSVNATTGVVTLDQRQAVGHPNANDPDDTVTLSGANLVKLTATAKDGDLDTAAQTLDITSRFAFKDDGPSIGHLLNGIRVIDNSIVDFAKNATATKSLEGATGADTNATPYTIDSFTTDITINDTPLKGVLSADKQTVTYYADTNKSGTFGD